MAWKLAEAFVQFNGDSKPFAMVLAGVKSSLSGLADHYEKIKSQATKLFVGLSAVAGFAVKSFADSESASNALRMALTATGQEVDQNYARYNRLAEALQAVNGQDKEQIKNAMAQALYMGVTANNIESVTRMGVGLGKALFGGDTEQGIKAAAKAIQGEMGVLGRFIPALSQAKNETEQLAIVQQVAESGWVAATAQSDSLTVRLRMLWTQIGEVGETIGGVLAPWVVKACNFLQNLTDIFQNLSPATQQMVVLVGGVAAALAGLVVILPSVVAAFAALGAVFGVVFSWAGVIVGAIVAVGSAIAMMVGDGPTGLEIFASGWAKIGAVIINVIGYIIQGVAKMVQFNVWAFDKIVQAALAVAGVFANVSEMSRRWDMVRNGIDGAVNSVDQFGAKLETVSGQDVTEFFSNMKSQIAGLFNNRPQLSNDFKDALQGGIGQLAQTQLPDLKVKAKLEIQNTSVEEMFKQKLTAIMFGGIGQKQDGTTIAANQLKQQEKTNDLLGNLYNWFTSKTGDVIGFVNQ